MASDVAPRVMPAPTPAPFYPFRTIPGRLLVLASASLALVWLVSLAAPIPPIVEAFRKVASFAFRVSAIWLAVLVIIRYRRQFLWRVRRKLILSYVFLGFVPVALVLVFASVGAFILHVTMAAFLFNEGIDTLVAEVHQVAVTAANEIAQDPLVSGVVITGQKVRAAQFRNLSLAVVSTASSSSTPVATAGLWRHMNAPGAVPAWVLKKGGFKGVLAMALPGATLEGERLLIRAAVPLADGGHVIVVDLPVDTDMVARLDESTGARMRSLTVTRPADADPATLAQPVQAIASVGLVDDTADDGISSFSLFRRTVMFMDFTDWRTGNSGSVSVSLDAPLGQLLSRMSSADGRQLTVFSGAEMLGVTIALAVLLFIVQGVALFFGAGLGRQITYAVHELFIGTERVQQGDFTHRIKIDAQDQLGALADSYNRMSASIEHLLHVQREKQRLDDELRIARDIQQSLLPEKPPVFPGLTIADLCVPAREVGGDYYDFFQLGPRQLGVLVADVSGKGTSAALYMAELKGLMLALSHEERSPKRLLTRVNTLLADHLDNRSFITMTYAVIDLEARTLTHARAGHTPLLVASSEGVEVLVPNGMVLGLRLPGIAHRFESLLEEHTRAIAPGDAIVFYTDGITEAMDVTGELFTDAALSRIVLAHHTLDATGIRERVLREVKAFVGEAEPHDDMTMVIVKVEASV
jgi:serine phosphatase RsbU (regulator of sigma subunit)